MAHGTSLPSDFKKIIEQISEEHLQTMLKNYANQVKQECMAHATAAIEQFYGAYTPHVYNRQGSFYDTPRVTMSKTDKYQYSIEIRFVSALDGYHHDDDSYIYSRVVYEGIHGTRDIAVTTSVEEYFVDWLKSYCD